MRLWSKIALLSLAAGYCIACGSFLRKARPNLPSAKTLQSVEMA